MQALRLTEKPWRLLSVFVAASWAIGALVIFVG
jgi:hypothetical protein